MAYLSIFLILASIVLILFSNRYAVLIAYAGLWVSAAAVGFMPYKSLIFWGVATLIVIALAFTLPQRVSSSRRGLGYIAGAAIAGGMVGLIISHPWMVIGAIVGAVLGGIAYSKTPAGKALEFPSSKFLNYLCAKGLPAVVTMCIAGTALMWLITIF